MSTYSFTFKFGDEFIPFMDINPDRNIFDAEIDSNTGNIFFKNKEGVELSYCIKLENGIIYTLHISDSKVPYFYQPIGVIEDNGEQKIYFEKKDSITEILKSKIRDSSSLASKETKVLLMQKADEETKVLLEQKADEETNVLSPQNIVKLQEAQVVITESDKSEEVKNSWVTIVKKEVIKKEISKDVPKETTPNTKSISKVSDLPSTNREYLSPEERLGIFESEIMEIIQTEGPIFGGIKCFNLFFSLQNKCRDKIPYIFNMFSDDEESIEFWRKTNGHLTKNRLPIQIIKDNMKDIFDGRFTVSSKIIIIDSYTNDSNNKKGRVSCFIHPISFGEFKHK